jgi:hypothetical protein
MTTPEQLYDWYPLPEIIGVEFKRTPLDITGPIPPLHVDRYPRVILDCGPGSGLRHLVIEESVLLEMTNPVTGTFFEWDDTEYTTDEGVAAIMTRLRERINTAAQRLADRMTL